MTKEVEELVFRAENFHGGYNFDQTKALVMSLGMALKEAEDRAAATKAKMGEADSALRSVGEFLKKAYVRIVILEGRLDIAAEKLAKEE